MHQIFTNEIEAPDHLTIKNTISHCILYVIVLWYICQNLFTNIHHIY